MVYRGYGSGFDAQPLTFKWRPFAGKPGGLCRRPVATPISSGVAGAVSEVRESKRGRRGCLARIVLPARKASDKTFGQVKAGMCGRRVGRCTDVDDVIFQRHLHMIAVALIEWAGLKTEGIDHGIVATTGNGFLLGIAQQLSAHVLATQRFIDP